MATKPGIYVLFFALLLLLLLRCDAARRPASGASASAAATTDGTIHLPDPGYDYPPLKAGDKATIAKGVDYIYPGFDRNPHAPAVDYIFQAPPRRRQPPAGVDKAMAKASAAATTDGNMHVPDPGYDYPPLKAGDKAAMAKDEVHVDYIYAGYAPPYAP